MVGWFIIAIATLAIFAFIAVNGVQTVAQTTDSVGRVETVRKLEGAASALIARAGSPNNTGNMMILAGVTVDGIYGLPAELSSFATTSFGQRIVYCPFGSNEAGSSSTNVPSGSSTTYPIQTRADADGKVYVTSGRPGFPQVAQNPNLMGYLLAPRTKTSATPFCSQVRFNASTNRFEAPDAIVRPIIRESSSAEQRDDQGREVVYWVSQNGTGTGLSSADPSSLYSAITYYRGSQPQAMKINMAPGQYLLPNQYMNYTVGSWNDKGNNSTLVIDGGGAADIGFDGAGISDISLPGNLELRNLIVESRAGLTAENGHSLTMTNTQSGHVLVRRGGNLIAQNVTFNDVRNGGALVVEDKSSANLSGTVNLRGFGGNAVAYVRSGSTANFRNANVNIASNDGTVLYFGIYNEENSDIVVRDSNLTAQTTMSYPFLVLGDTTFYNSNFSFSAASSRIFEIQRGGFLTLVGGTMGLGAVPAVGIVDVGAMGVSGNATIRASNCWINISLAGVQFTHSNSGNGASSAVVADEAIPAMSPTPTAAEVQNNAAVNARNTRRAQLRNTNTSTFTCRTS